MSAQTQKLEELRREIDEIDAALHQLVLRRTEVAQAIGKTKSGGGPIMRPSREAEILRALAARHTGPFPLAALLRMWREMIAALTRLQGPFSAAVFAPGDTLHFWDLARDHFGSTTPMTPIATSTGVVRAVTDGSCTVGVLPWPDEEAAPEPWWRYLFSDDAKAPRIIARLPFLQRQPGRGEESDAVAVAVAPLDASGDDHTFIGIEVAGDLSRSRLKEMMEKANLPPAQMRSHHLSSGGSLNLVLVEQFVDKGDRRLGSLARKLGDAAVRLMPVGTYSTPLETPPSGNG